ncbi:hypothetical protein LINGRAHAP2_LOCUS17735 [Linum grandiflorum]
MTTATETAKMAGEAESLHKRHMIWSLLSQLSFNLSIFLFRLPPFSIPLLMIGWISAMVFTYLHTDPLVKGRRIGRFKRTALEVACLLAATATRYFYDPYNNSDKQLEMYYYAVLILATHQVYTHLKSFLRVADLEFGDLWSVIVMQSLVYWMPTELMAASTVAVCFATISCRYGGESDRESVIPDPFGWFLGFGLAIAAFGYPVFLLAHGYQEGVAGLFGLKAEVQSGFKQSLMISLVLFCTLIVQWIDNKINEDGSTKKMKKEDEQVNPEPVGIQKSVEPLTTAATASGVASSEAKAHDEITKSKEE